MSDDLAPTDPAATAPRPPAGMSSIAKLGIALAVIVALMAGAWWYGRSGVAPDRAVADATRLRMLLLESRAQVLDAQLGLHAANFGNAQQHLEYARPPLTAATDELRRLGHDALATKSDAALEQIASGRDLAAKLSLDAASRCGEASRLLGEVLAGLPR